MLTKTTATLGRNVRRCRIAAGLRLDAGAAVGLPAATLQAIEEGREDPEKIDLGTLAALGALVDADPADLLTG